MFIRRSLPTLALLALGAISAIPRVLDAEDVFVPGSLSVAFGPAESPLTRRQLDDGDPDAKNAEDQWARDALLAGWRLVDEEEWRASDDPLNDVRPGTYTVEFRPVAGWRRPSPTGVVVAGGAQTIVVATYYLLPTYRVGEIPAFVNSWQDDASSFYVVPGEGGGTVSVNSGGAAVFDSDRGAFSFEPDADEHADLVVSFAAGTTIQEVTITPQLLLPEEEEVIDWKFPLPDDDSLDYLTVTVNEVPVSDPPFNQDDSLTELREVTISGKTVVFAPGHPSQLHERFSWNALGDAHDVQALVIFADTVVIGAPTRFPETAVTLFARELRFEDKEGELATLSTKPLTDPIRVGSEGPNTAKVGRRAGDLTLNVQRFSTPDEADEPRIRLIVEGGDGQSVVDDGADGRDGTLVGVCSLPGLPADPVVVKYTSCPPDPFGPNHPEHCDRTGSLDGEDARESTGGLPGDAGDGGTLRATLDLGHVASLAGGVSGGPEYVGGRAAEGLFVIVNCRGGTLQQADIDPYVPRDGRGPLIAKPVGDHGEFTLVEAPSSWLHPLILGPILEYARDAYVRGNTDETRVTLKELAAELDLLAQGPIPASVSGFQRELEQARTEIEGLLQRLDAGLDYFGNPPDWVPLLSFETQLEAFQDEIEASLRTLYLAHVIGTKAEKILGTVDALTVAKDETQAQYEVMANEYNGARAELTGLRAQWESVSTSVERLEAELLAIEERLIRRAAENVEERNKLPLWKRGVLIGGGILQYWPGGKLTTKVARKLGGKTIGAVGETDSDETVGEFFRSAFEETADDIGGTIDLFDPDAGGGDPGAIKEAALQALVAPAKDIRRGVTNKHVPPEELEAELSLLRATDPAFDDVVTEILTLMARKEQLATGIQQVTQRVTDLASGLFQAQSTILQINNNVDNLAGRVDPKTALAVRRMEQRAKDRLLWYQYLAAKSYQYRLLLPYQGVEGSGMDLGRLFDQLVEIAEVNVGDPATDYELSAADFETLEAIYTDHIREIFRKVFADLQEPNRRSSVAFALLPEEVQELNEKGTVTINLTRLARRNIFGDNEEDLRIVDLRIHDLAVTPVGGEYGGTANLRIDFAHSGVMRLREDGQTYRFDQRREATTSKIVWKTIYDGVDDTLSEDQISPADASLLCLALECDPSTIEDRLLYSRPSADAEIVISKDVDTDNGIDMRIDRLRLKVEYDYALADGRLRILEILAPEDIRPTISIDSSDLHSRREGRGDVTRVFLADKVVSIQAPAAHGVYVFEKWVDDKGQDLETDNTLVTTLTDKTTLVPVYRLATSPAATRILRGDCNGDAHVDISDAVCTLNWLFLGADDPGCIATVDVDGSGEANISDPIYLLNFLFQGGPMPVAPFPDCGPLPTREVLSCDSPPEACR